MPAEHCVFSLKSLTRPSFRTMSLMSCPPTSTMTCGFCVELHRRLGVRDSLHQRDVGLQHVFQHILGVAGGADAQDFERAALRFDLLPQMPRTCRWCPGWDCRRKAGRPCTARHRSPTAAQPWSKSIRRRVPMKPLTVWPGVNFAPMNLGMRYFFFEAAPALRPTCSGRPHRTSLSLPGGQP